MICSRCGGPRDRGKDQRYCCACHAAYMRDWRLTHQETPEQAFKSNVRSLAHYARRKGVLKPEPCAHCLSDGVEMHHADYSRPLDVVFLCRPCHLRVHRRLRAIRVSVAGPTHDDLTMADLAAKYAAGSRAHEAA